jgi:signal transduction histidine kinase
LTAAVALFGWLVAALSVQRGLAARELAARACHEVRGPLTAAGMALHLMDRHGEAPPERLAALDAQLRRAALALEDLSAARRGRLAADRIEPVSVATLLARLQTSWAPVCAAEGRPLRVGLAPPGLSVLADPTRLAQAVGNLIANAIEHGRGTIEVRPRCVDGRLRLEVRDGGPGLGRPLAEVLSGARGGRGRRGRGLAIAAGIAGRHGGALTTAPGGSALVLELPLAGGGRRMREAR